jgi:hypothetical protein
MDSLWVSRDGTSFTPIALPYSIAKKDSASDEVLSPGYGLWRSMSVDASGDLTALVSSMIVRIPLQGASEIRRLPGEPASIKSGAMFGAHVLIDSGAQLLESFDRGASFSEAPHPHGDLPVACFSEGCSIGNGLRLGDLDAQSKPATTQTSPSVSPIELTCSPDPSVIAAGRAIDAQTNTWAPETPWFFVDDSDGVIVHRAVADHGNLAILSVEIAARHTSNELRYIVKQPEGVAVVSARGQKSANDIVANGSLNVAVAWWNARTNSVHHGDLQVAPGAGDLDARDKLAHFRPAVFSMTEDGVFLSPFSVGRRLFWVPTTGPSRLVAESTASHSCSVQTVPGCNVLWVEKKPVIANTFAPSNVGFGVWDSNEWQPTAWALGKSKSRDFSAVWRGNPVFVTQTDDTVWLTPLQLTTEPPVSRALRESRSAKNLLRPCKELCDAGKNCATIPFQFRVSLETPSDSDAPVLAMSVNRQKFHATSALESEDADGACTQSLVFTADGPRFGEVIVWLAHPEMSTFLERLPNSTIAHPARCQLP